MEIKFAVLGLLAECPDGRARLDELARELEARDVSQDTVTRFSDLDSIDLLNSGLVVQENDQLQITQAGRAVWRAIVELGEPPRAPVSNDRPQSLKLIDDLIGIEQRLKIFDLDLRSASEPFIEPFEEESDAEQPGTRSAIIDPIDDVMDPVTVRTWDRHEDVRSRALLVTEPIAGRGCSTQEQTRVSDPPAFLKRDFGPRPAKAELRKRDLGNSISNTLRRFFRIWRGHIRSETIGQPRHPNERHAGGFGGVVVVALTLLLLVVSAGILIAISQIRSLKSEIAALERELAPLKKQAATLPGAEKRLEFNRVVEAKERLDARLADRNGNAVQSPPVPSTLVLSSDELRLIRDYIKPAPSAGTAAASINIGDTVASGTIPLPSPLTEKIPKLQGARFTIRNGSIVILKRDSQKADAVLPPL